LNAKPQQVIQSIKRLVL